MAIIKVTQPPQDIQYYGEDDLTACLTEREVDDICEIFQTPLTGHYNWDYDSADGRIRKLYRLGKELNWNAEVDIDWSRTLPKSEYPVDPMFNPFVGYEPFEKMTDQQKLDFSWHNQSWTLS